MRESVREVKLQSKAVVVLYRGNDFWLEEQDPYSEARDINKYIYSYRSREFSHSYYCLLLHYYICNINISFAVQAGGVESEASSRS